MAPLDIRIAALLTAAGMLIACGPADAPAPPPPAVPVAEPSAAEPTPEPPAGAISALLITIDTLRADHVGAYGGPDPTPAMDRLGAEGVVVEQAVTPVPTTGPAHASLMTGFYPWRHGVLNNAVRLAPDLTTVAEHAHSAGFRTAAFVSSFILDERFDFDRGFETYWFEPSRGYFWRGKQRDSFFTRGEETTRAANRWITAHVVAGGGPFFLWVHYFDPHMPYEPPSHLKPDGSDVDLSGKVTPYGPEQLVDDIRAYRGEVRYVDAEVGKLIDHLRKLGLLDDVAVVLTSDHGEGLGDHGALEHGVNVFAELVDVPLLVRAKGIPPGRRLAGSSQLEDLHPTLLHLMGLPRDEVDGFDLTPWLRGEVDVSPRPAVIGRRKPSEGMRDLFFFQRFPEKWIGRIDRKGMFFDLSLDPGELQPGQGSGAPLFLRDAVASGSRAPAAQDVDPETRRALEALGYID